MPRIGLIIGFIVCLGTANWIVAFFAMQLPQTQSNNVVTILLYLGILLLGLVLFSAVKKFLVKPNWLVGALLVIFFLLALAMPTQIISYLHKDHIDNKFN